MYALIDCNNFFVSCERVFRPELAMKPVIVLSNNDGCAVALSNEAKQLGFKRGDPYFKIRAKAEQNGVVTFSGNHRLYGDMSARVMATLRLIADDIEVYSVDEAFLNLGTEFNDLETFGRMVARKVKRDTGIPVSVGIAPTKTLAKVAALFAKKYPGYKGACVIDDDAKRLKALSLTDIDKVWGIGRRHSRHLREGGITTALQFAQLDRHYVSRTYTIVGERTWRELNGDPCIERESTPTGRRTITSSRSFSKEIYDLESLRQAMCSFATNIGRKLREQGGYALEMSAFIATNRFNDRAPQYVNTRSFTFPEPTADTATLTHAATLMLRSMFRNGYGIKKAGLTVSRIVSAEGRQHSIFSNINDIARRDKLMTTVDSINNAQGDNNCVRLAAMGNGLSDITRRDHASRLYTTRLSDIISINCKH